MTIFRTTLAVMILLIVTFTVSAIAQDGVDLITPFMSPIFAMTWQGQFNVDFSLYLLLSGIWMAWRGGLTGRSIALGLLAPPLGMLFFAPYLLWLTFVTGGDIKRLLLGVHAT